MAGLTCSGMTSDSVSTEAKRRDVAAAEIMFVIGQLQIGGTEKHLASVVPMLAQRGWKVSVCVLLDDGPLRGVLEDAGICVFGPLIGPRKGRGTVGRVVRAGIIALRLFMVMRRHRPVVVHCFLPFSYLVGAPVATLARIPLKVMSRRSSNDYQRGHPILTLVERKLHGRMDVVLANSKSVVRQLKRDEAVPQERLGLIYNGIDLRPFCSDRKGRVGVRNDLGIEGKALVLIVVANLIPYKGHVDLIESLHFAKTKLRPGWRLLVVGRDDGYGAEVRSRVADRCLQNNVMFLGARDDVVELLHASDIAINCSHEEGFSNAVLEGMAAGLPVIVTDVGGNSEAVINGESGLVVSARQPRELAEAILRLVAEPELRARLGDAARRRVSDHFTLSRCVSDYEFLYSELLESGKVAAEIRSKE